MYICIIIYILIQTISNNKAGQRSMCVPLFGPFSLHAMAVVLPAHFVPQRPGRPCLDGGAVVELKRTEDTEGSGAVESPISLVNLVP